MLLTFLARWFQKCWDIYTLYLWLSHEADNDSNQAEQAIRPLPHQSVTLTARRRNADIIWYHLPFSDYLSLWWWQLTRVYDAQASSLSRECWHFWWLCAKEKEEIKMFSRLSLCSTLTLSLRSLHVSILWGLWRSDPEMGPKFRRNSEVSPHSRHQEMKRKILFIEQSADSFCSCNSHSTPKTSGKLSFIGIKKYTGSRNIFSSVTE